MEMKEIAKHKTLWKMSSTSEPLLVTGIELSPLKKFTIPKIRKTAGKVYLSPCYTNTREYSFIHDTLTQCRLDVSCDLQSSWQFGETKLIHNEDLEKSFTAKRTEMRESGRHGRELEEHFCFLALPQSDVLEIYQNGISTKTSTLKILGNPLLGIYVFRHVDVALNYAHSRSITIENIIIFKVLFGKVKKIQPSVDKNKVSLDPSPNFDCHMSKSIPSLKDTIELQAFHSAVYFYEYNVFSKPVHKPRQCLPYAVVTVKFIGQKVDNGHLMTSLRFLTGFPKKTERTCSLNNCTVAKRIGKGKDATVIFEHFGKPVDSFVQENCSCNTLNSEINPSSTNIFNSYENMQNGNISKRETYSGQIENNLAEIRHTQVHDSDLSFTPSDNRESGNGDLLLNFTYLKNILSGLSAAFPPHNNGSSTVTTSKLIKDPRLMKREENMGKQNNSTGLSEILPFEKNLDYVTSEVNLSSMSTNSVSSSEVVPHAILTNCLDVSSFKFSFDDSQSQTQNIDSKDHHCTASNKITMTGQCKDQDSFSFPISLSNVVSEVENQKYSEEEAQIAQERSNIPLLIKQNSEPLNFYEPLNTCTKEFNNHISKEPQSSNLKTIYQTAHQMSTVFPFQKKPTIDEYVENTRKMRNLTDPEDSSKHGEKQTMWKETDNETKTSPIENYISLHQEYKEDRSLDSFGEKYDKILITQELEMTKSPSSTTKNKEEPDHLALKLENNLTPSIQCLSQKHQHTLEYEDSIHTSFAIAQKLMELTLEKTNQNCVSIMTDAFQKAKDIPQAKELFINTVISSHAIETALDKSNCNITREYTCVQRKSENEPVSLENIQRDCKEISHIEDKGQNHILFCDTQMNNDIYPNTNFKGQGGNDKENENKAEKENTAPPENNREKIYGDKKQGFHINNTLTDIDERRDNKNYSTVEIPSSEELSTTFNLIWGEKDRATGTTLLESGHTVTSIKQRGIQNTGRSVEHLASMTFSDITDSSVGEASNTAVQEYNTAMPTLSTNHEDHQRNQFKETCSSESPDFGSLIKHRVSGYQIDMDRNKLQDSFHQSVNENSFLLNFELENEIEVETEQCDAHSHRHVLYNEFESSYEALKSRIDWEGLFGSNNGKMEVWGSTRRKENSDQHYSKQSICFYSSKQKFLTPILLPDLQVRITNTFRPGFSPIDDSPARKDNSYKCTTKATKPEKSAEWNAPGFEIYYQASGENSGFPCEEKFGNSTQNSGLVSKPVVSHSSDLSHNIYVNHMSEKQNSESLSTESFNITTMNECKHSFTKSKTDFNGTRSKKDMESRISKRKLHTSFRDQNISHKDLRQHEICGKKKRLTSQDSSEHFSSLSQGRIETFSQSERHIRSVLDILNSEASLCKSKRLSRKLDRAVLHLKKAHRRVHTSLQLITKVGEKRKGPLPRAYAIICNNFWESCDLQGYSSVSERRYSTKHFLSKRKYDKKGEKRALGCDVDKSLARVSKHTSYKTHGEKIAKSHSKKSVASSVSRSHTSNHEREFHDQEQHPESQFPLFSTSQSTSQLEYGNSSIRDSRSSELQPFSGKAGCLLYPDEKLTEKENQIDIKLSNISKYKRLDNILVHNDATKNSEATEVTNDSNSVSLSCIKEDNLIYNTDKNYEATCIAHTKMKTDILLSVLDSNVKHFLNVDIYKRDKLIIPGCERNLDVNFPVERWITPIENSKASITTGSFSMDPFNLTLITSKKYSIPQLLSTTSVTDSEEESSVSYLDKQRIFAIDSFATSMTISQCQISGGKGLLNTEQFCSSNSCLHINANKTSVTEYSELGLTSVTEESKNYGKNIVKKLFSKGSSLFLQDYKKCSSKICISKKDIQDRKIRKIEQAGKANDSFYKKVMTELSTVKIEYKNQKNKILKEESSHLNMKTVKNKLMGFHPIVKNTTAEAVSLSNRVSGQLKKKKEGIKVGSDSQSSYISKPSILGIHCMPILHGHCETSKVTTHQKKSTSYMNELKEKHCPAHHTALIEELSHILQRADKASSLQILEEEIKVCQNSLPLFVEAFERKQECSVEQILISRELLVEQNLWNNCKHKLKPCAIDTLVELQMMMETIQFIENKQRLLKGEPTFRSLLWYDETLYSELLGRPRGYQLQSNFYPAFQGRLKYNAFCELQDYHNQLVELYAETKRENNSYYAFLKYKRQINECEAIMKQCSDCFDFSLSVPFTCGVNFGDSLGDLETLRKYTLKLISMYGDSPEVHTYPGKQDHLWIIIEMISSKVNFIKSNEALTIKISLYGLEHIFFDAAKNLVWKERRQSFSKKYSQKKNKEVLLKINEYAFSKLQKIYDHLSKDLNNEPTSNIVLEKDTIVASRKADDLINIENCRLNSTLLSHPDICCISEILDQAEFADLKTLQELTLRCTDHLEILKKYFQMLQEDNIDNIFITEENVLDMLKKHNHGTIILKPAAVETYIEIVMLSETVHFLKNSMAKKLDSQRFRGMLWFDLSLLPELVHCQEKMASFSFLKDNPTECLWSVIETAISELKKDLDIIYKYNEAINCSYALHLFSRELKELSEIKKLLKKSEYSISTYIDFVPYIASINYGNTVMELEHNYSQFSTLLKNVMSVPKKDLGKMAHIMKVMKTIEHMKIICAKDAKSTNSFILCQMLHNRRNTSQLRRKEKMNIHVIKPGENINKSSTSVEVPSISECLIKNIANSSKKRPITVDKCEDSEEKEKNTTISSCKRQKINMKDVTEINKEKSTFKHSRTTRSHPKNENETRSSASDHLKRNNVSPRKVEMQRSLPDSLLPFKNLQDTSISKSESKTDLTNSSSGTPEHPTGQQENLNSIKKRNMNFDAAKTKSDKDCASFATCDQKSIDSTSSEDHKTPSQRCHKNPPNPAQKTHLSNINPGTDDSVVPNASMLSKPVSHSMGARHSNLEMNDTIFEHEDNEMLTSSIKKSTYTNSLDPMYIQDKIPVPQENKTQPAKTKSEEKYMKDTLNPSTIPFGASGNLTLDVNQRAEYSFSEQQDEENPKVLNQKAGTCWNELPQSAGLSVYNSSEHSYGTSYPYYAWCVYHYSSSNGNAITHRYQGIASYEVHPPPSGLLTTVSSTVQNTHSNLLYSQYFSYFAEPPQADAFVPVNGYFQSQMPISYHFQPPNFPQYASYQPLPQAPYPYPPNPSVLPEVPWIYAPWQQEPFQPGH